METPPNSPTPQPPPTKKSRQPDRVFDVKKLRRVNRIFWAQERGVAAVVVVGGALPEEFQHPQGVRCNVDTHTHTDPTRKYTPGEEAASGGCKGIERR